MQGLDAAPRGRPLVILYNRVSTEEQASGEGVGRQRMNAEKYCVANRITADALLEDTGYSAYTGDHLKRGQLGRILMEISNGRILPGSTLIIESLDRISRQQPFEALKLFFQILEKDVTIVTSIDGHRYTTDGNSVDRMLTIVLSVIQFGRSNSESEVKSIRVADAWMKKNERARRDKEPHGRRCPGWIRLNSEGRYELIPERARRVQWMCLRAIEGWGRRRIVKELIAEGVEVWFGPTKNGRERSWNDSYVHRILTSGEARGDYHPSKSPKGKPKTYEEVVEDYYPPAVDRLTFNRAKAAICARRGGGGPKGKLYNIFQNLCRCSSCGHGMTWEDKGRRSGGPNLVCRRATLGDCEHKRRYEYELLELQLIACLGQHADQLLKDSQLQIGDMQISLDVMKLEAADIAGKIKNLVAHMEIRPDPSLSARLSELRLEADAIDGRIQKSQQIIAINNETQHADSPHLVVRFYEQMQSMPKKNQPTERARLNQVLRSLIRQVMFSPEGKIVVDFNSGTKAYIFKTTGTKRARTNPGQFAPGTFEGRQARRKDRETAWKEGFPVQGPEVAHAAMER
jgi:DNA invertase Pin-like site-specific DNA recombinase